MTATVMVMKIVTKRWLWAIRPWTADATAAGFTLSHPTTQRVATTIIAIDLIDRQDWPPAGKIADHSRLKSVITVVPCLADGRSGNAESESCRDEKDDFFHCIELAVQDPSTQAFGGYSTLLKLFCARHEISAAIGAQRIDCITALLLLSSCPITDCFFCLFGCPFF